MSTEPASAEGSNADLNPYAPPHTDPPERPLRRSARRWIERASLQRICVAQLLVLMVGLGLEWFDVETILLTGPSYLVVGVLTCLIAHRDSKPLAMLLGLSAISLAIGVYLLIVLNSWGPRQADGPVSIIIRAYGAIAIPTLLYVTTARSESNTSREPSFPEA